MKIVDTHRDLPKNAIVLKKVLEQAIKDKLSSHITYDRFIGSTPPLRKWGYRVEGGRDIYVVYEDLKKSILEEIEAVRVLACVKAYIDETNIITLSALRKESGGLLSYRVPYAKSYKKAVDAVKWLRYNHNELVKEATSVGDCWKNR